jgi:hypothetical protein
VKHNYTNKKFYQKGLVARVFAAFIDAVSVVILAIISAAAVAFPIANEIGLRDEATFIRLVRYSSGLYVQLENNALAEVSDETKLPQALYTFYVDVPVGGDEDDYERGYSPILDPAKREFEVAYNTPEDYYVFILGKNSASTPFDFSQGINHQTPWEVAIKGGQTETAKALYKDAYEKALGELNQYPPFIQASQNADNYTLGSFGFSFLFSSLVMIVLFPILNKEGVSLGKKLLGLTIANSLGYKLTKPQALFRGFNSFLLYYLLFLLPISFASFIVLILNKQQKSLVDLLAGTIVLDKKNSVVFANATEEKITNIHIAKKMVESRMRDEEFSEEQRQKLTNK